MELNYVNTLPLGGFNYDNCLRNKALEANLGKEKKLSYTKTGTTICGIIFNVSSQSMPDKCRNIDEFVVSRKESLLQLTPVPPEAASSVIRTARRSITSLLTSSAAGLEPLLTVTTSLVSKDKF